MKNLKNILSEFNHERKGSIKTLYEIQMNAKRKNIDSYKKVFIIKKEIEIEKENNEKKEISHSSTNSIPKIFLSHTSQDHTENRLFINKGISKRKYSLIHLKQKAVLKDMQEIEQKIKAKVKKRAKTSMIRSKKDFEDFTINFRGMENSVLITRNKQKENLDQLCLLSTDTTLCHQNQEEEFKDPFNIENYFDSFENLDYPANPICHLHKEIKISFVENQNLSHSLIDIKSSQIKNINNNIKMNSKTSASFSSISTKNLRKTVTKLDKDMEEKEKFKKAVLSKNQTKSTTNIMKKDSLANTTTNTIKKNSSTNSTLDYKKNLPVQRKSIIKSYGLVSKAVTMRKNLNKIEDKSKSQILDSKVNQSHTLDLPSSDSVLEKEKEKILDSSRGIISLDFNVYEFANNNSKNVENLGKPPEIEINQCELSNIYEDTVEKEDNAEEKGLERKNILAENLKNLEEMQEFNIEHNIPSMKNFIPPEKNQDVNLEDKTFLNKSVSINFKNSFTDLLMSRVNDINFIYENQNKTNTILRDKEYNINSQINFAIVMKEKKKLFYITNQNTFDILTTTNAVASREKENQNEKGNGTQVETDYEKTQIVKKNKKADLLRSVTEICDTISPNIENAERKKSIEEYRIKTLDNINKRESLNEIVNIQEINYEIKKATKTEIKKTPEKKLVDNTIKINQQNELNEILVKNKKFSELLEIMDKPITENERYSQKINIMKDERPAKKKIESVNQVININLSKMEENSKSLKNTLANTKKLITQKDSCLETKSQILSGFHTSKKKGIYYILPHYLEYFIKPNESLNLNILNELQNSNNNLYRRDINPISYAKINLSSENNINTYIKSDSINNKFYDEKLATNFAHRYIKKENRDINKSQTNISLNNPIRNINLYGSENTNKSLINTSHNENINTKYSINFINNDIKSHKPNSNYIDTLKINIENDRMKSMGKFPTDHDSSSNKNHIFVRKIPTDQRFFNILPSNDIDLRQIRMNKGNMMHLINNK